MSWVCINSLLLMFICVPPVFGLVSTFYHVAPGYKMSGGTVLKNITQGRMSRVYCSMLCTSECGSATCSEKFNTCVTFKEKFYNSTISWSRDLDWSILYRNELIQHGDWTLVFRAQKGINTSFYSLWTNSGYHDDSPLSSGFPIGCYRTDNMDTCNRHFRSSILDNWTNISQVRVSLFANGSEVAYMVFNGSSSTRESWYTKWLVLESSWTSLKNDNSVTSFDFLGFVSSLSIRRMAICGPYAGCNSDTTYFLAIDVPYEDCRSSWSLAYTDYPIFVYSALNRIAKLSTVPAEYKYADVLAIFVKKSP